MAQLRGGQPGHDEALRRLHELLHRAARHELSRRRHQLRAISGPELEDLADQSADDALINILAKLDEFQGRSRFTTWAYKFAIFEVSAKVARHAWRHSPPRGDALVDEQLRDPLVRRPEDRLNERAQLGALARSIRELTPRQQDVFVAVALNEVPIDVVALKLGTNRNAVYKNLFDARRSLRAKMAAAGHPVGG